MKLEEMCYYKTIACDVLVCGGGTAGISAAVQAARLGKKVILIEQYGFLGGAAVAGLSGTICGMYYASEKDSKPRQLVYGFTQEFVARLEKMNGITPPQKYGKTFLRTHDAFKFKCAADNFLKEAGVQVFLHSKAVFVQGDQNKVTSVVVDTKNGMILVEPAVVIDATGDGDIVFRAGMGTYKGDHGKIQNPTMIFKVSNVQMEPFLAFMKGDTIAPASLSEQIKKSHEAGEFFLPRDKIWLFDTVHDGEVLCNCTRIIGTNGEDLDVTDVADHTQAEINGRMQVENYFAFFKKYVPGFEKAYITDTGAEVGVRQTRSIQGSCQLKNADVEQCKKTADGIVRSAWPIELHSGNAPKLHWILDDYYTVPFGSVLSR